MDNTIGENEAARQPPSSSSEDIAKIHDSLAEISSAMKEMGSAFKAIADSRTATKRKRQDSGSDHESLLDGDDDDDRRDHEMSDSEDDAAAINDMLQDGGAAPNPATSDVSSKDQDKILEELDADMDDMETGPEISPKLANIINKRFEKKLSADTRKEKQNKYCRPKNCDKMKVPKVNTEVWRQLNAYQKKQDIRVANMQTTLSKAATAVAQVTDHVLSVNKAGKNVDVAEVLTKQTDALTLIGHTMIEMSVKRREAMKPALKREYASLCANEVPITENLFGNELSKTKISNRPTRLERIQADTTGII